MPVEAFKSLLGMSNLHLATFICWNTRVLPLQACFQFPPNNGAALSFFHKIERVRTRYAFNFSLDPNASHSRWRCFGFVRCSGTCFGLHIAVFWQYLVRWKKYKVRLTDLSFVLGKIVSNSPNQRVPTLTKENRDTQFKAH